MPASTGPVIDSRGPAIWGAGSTHAGGVQFVDPTDTAWSTAGNPTSWCGCPELIRSPFVKAAFSDDVVEFCPDACQDGYGGPLVASRPMAGQSACLGFQGGCDCTCVLLGGLDGGVALRYDFGSTTCTGTPCRITLPSGGTVGADYVCWLELVDATTTPHTYRFSAFRYFSFTSGGGGGTFRIVRNLVFHAGNFTWDWLSPITLSNVLPSTQDCASTYTALICGSIFGVGPTSRSDANGGAPNLTGGHGGTVTLTPITCATPDPCAGVSGPASIPDLCDLTGNPTNGDGSGTGPGSPGQPGGSGGPGGPRYPPTTDVFCAYRWLAVYDCATTSWSGPVLAGYATDRDLSDWTFVRSETVDGKTRCLYELWTVNDSEVSPCPTPTAAPTPPTDSSACPCAAHKKLFTCDPAGGTGTDSTYTLPLTTIVADGLAGKVLETEDGSCLRVTAADATTPNTFTGPYTARDDCDGCFYQKATACPGQSGTVDNLYVRASAVALGVVNGKTAFLYDNRCYYVAGGATKVPPSALPDPNVLRETAPDKTDCDGCCAACASGLGATLCDDGDHSSVPDVIVDLSPLSNGPNGCDGNPCVPGQGNPGTVRFPHGLCVTADDADSFDFNGDNVPGSGPDPTGLWNVRIDYIDDGLGHASWNLYVLGPCVSWAGCKGGANSTGTYTLDCGFGECYGTPLPRTLTVSAAP